MKYVEQRLFCRMPKVHLVSADPPDRCPHITKLANALRPGLTFGSK